MIIKRGGFLLCIIVALTSCGRAGKEDSKRKDNYVFNNKLLEKSAGLFKLSSLPFVVDTTFLFETEKGDSLGGFEIKMLAKNFFNHNLINGFQEGLATFLKIDSIKEVGKYKQYRDSLDIGMTEICTAHALNEFHLDSNTLILVWGIRAESYQACPYSNTWLTYFTVVYKGEVGETFLMGEYTSWADAPVSVERTVSSTLSVDGTLSVDVLQINDQDPDSATVEVNKERHVFMIKDGVLKLVSDKVEPTCSQNRKK